MNTLKIKLLQNWHAMRIIRLVLGAIAIAEFVPTKDWLFLMVGSVFLLQGIFNVGCNGAGACEWSPKNGQKNCQ